MHPDWQDDGVCPECRGHYVPGHTCYRCGGSGRADMDDDPEPLPLLPPYVPRVYSSACPRCKQPCDVRREDGARWCRACDRAFYTAEGPELSIESEADDG